MGILLLAVLVVGGVIATAEFAMSGRLSRLVSSAGQPKPDGKKANPSATPEPSELARKIAESGHRQRSKAAESKSAVAEKKPEPGTNQTASVNPPSSEPSDPSAGDPPPEVKSPRPVRPVSEILNELNRSHPKRSRGKGARAVLASHEEESRTRAALIGELYRADPKRANLPALMIERWMTLRDDPEAKAEREAAEAESASSAIGAAALYVNARLAVDDSSVDGDDALKLIEKFRAREKGRSPKTRELLGTLADRLTGEPAKRRELYQRIIALFPNTPDAALAMSRLNQLDDDKFNEIVSSGDVSADPRIGKVFEFAFQDAVSGELVSSEGLRGRVLVVDFWATWCRPCVESMPKLKELYAKYTPRGVAFLGVSLDRGDSAGLQTVLRFVSEHEIPWPQYLQKERELSKLWSVTSIPTIFVVDKNGRIVSKGGDLDRILTRLLDDGASSKSPRS